jgi:steroid delta-isomerase-like uncharacterized protein
MVVSGREHLLEDWATAWSSPNDADRLLSLFADDCTYEDVAMGVVCHNKDELRDFYNLVFSAFPDLKIELKTHFIADDQAGAEWVMTGTQNGDLPALPATHKTCNIRAATIMELQGDKIRRNTDYWDMAAFLQQVGILRS